MCERSSILTLFFVLKIIVLLIIPIVIIFIKKISYKKTSILLYFDISIISFLILLRIFNNNCVVNSNISGIKNSYYLNNNDYIQESNDPNSVSQIITNKKYKTNTGKDVYYFNNNQLPLSEKKILCSDNSEVYMKNYGNGITAVSMLLSSYYNENIDPISIMNLALEKEIFNCNNGVSIDSLIALVSDKYNVNFKEVSKNNLYNEVSNGNVILAEVKYTANTINVTCNKAYIIIYNIDNNNKYHILYSNDSTNDIICSDNSEGVLSIINKNLNSKEWDINSLNMITDRYMKLERK